jgi:hypothetical protein
MPPAAIDGKDEGREDETMDDDTVAKTDPDRAEDVT